MSEVSLASPQYVNYKHWSGGETFPAGYEPTTPWGKKLGRPLRVFGTPWHVAHQYELTKLPETVFYLLINPTRQWGSKARPLPANIVFVPEFTEGRYDLALLHIDQQCVNGDLGKALLFRQLKEVTKSVPQILINHGTPYWPEMYSSDDIINRMKVTLGDLIDHTVVNSDGAAKMWGFGTPIIHGLDPEEWWDLPKERRIITTLSPGGLDKYYNRDLLRNVQDLLRNDHNISMCHVTVDYAPKDFDDYRDFIGRSLIYFNPTLESPMPRSRTEAMTSGACTVSLNNHDIDKYIVDGESGYLVPNNVKACVAKLVELFYDYPTAIKIGQAGKRSVIEKLSIGNYQKQWTDYLTKTLSL